MRRSSPIASAKDMPRIEPIRATRTYGGTPSGMSAAIVATGPAGDNEDTDAALRVRVESSAVTWQQRRLLLVAGALVASSSHLIGSPIIAAVAIYGIAIGVLVGEAEVILARRARSEWQFDAITLVARVALVTVLAVALTFGGAGTWLTLGVLAVLVISVAGSVSTVSMVVVVAYTSAVFVTTEFLTIRDAVPHAHLVASHETGHMSILQLLGVALVAFPGLAAVVHLRWRASIETREELEERVDELRTARGALEDSRGELERLNRDLNAEVSQQTSELELRNRYLSVVNAVSTALGEPGNDEPLVGRAARIAGRLIGGSAAQGWQIASDTEPTSTFVKLDGESGAEMEALPLELLQEVADRREPLLSEDAVGPDGEPLPDPGGPFVVVPIHSHGESLGAFAVIGIEVGEVGPRERNLLLSVGREVGAALVNAAHIRNMETRADRVALLSDVAKFASGRRETRDALNEALAPVREHLDALRVSIVVSQHDGQGETLAVAGPPTEYSRGGRHIDRLRSEVANGQPVLYRRADGVLPEDVARGVGTMIVAPVVASVAGVTPFGDPPANPDAANHSDAERVVGALVCSSAEEDVWDADTVALITEVAEVVARRLEADAYARLQSRRIDELASLTEVARLMQSGADVERLCGGFAQALRALISYRALTIVRTSTFGSRDQVHQFDADALTVDSRPDASPPESASLLPEPVVWSGGTGPSLQELLYRPADSGVALPMLSKGQSVGAVVIGLEGGLDKELLSIVVQAVEQLALALDAAMLYQQATSRASQIQTQSNLARIVASQPDLRQAFDEFAEEMRWLVPFDQALLFLAAEDDSEQMLPYAVAPGTASPAGWGAPLDEAIVEVAGSQDQPFALHRNDLEHVTDEEWRTLGGDAPHAIIVPVRDRSRLMALFVLLSGSEQHGVGVDMNLLTEVASLLAVTIERLRLFERSEHMARHDQLTGLPNFRYVQEHLAAVGERSTGKQTSILMIDMDNLKPFNDQLGHEVGDRVIRIVARELIACSRAADFVGRVGGDEFVMVMEEVGANEALHVASRVHAALAQAHLEIDNAPRSISVSVGVASSPEDAATMAELLREADRAMYTAKSLGGGRSALARDGARRGAAPQSVGRAGRLTDVLLRSAAGNATEAERTAIALADRYAGLAAEQLGLDVSVLPALRVLVIASSVSRLDHEERRQEVAVARALLAAVDASTLVDHTVAPQVLAIAEGSVELAWVQTPGLGASPVDAEEATRHLESLLSRPEAQSAGTVLASIVRHDAAERRSNERVA